MLLGCVSAKGFSQTIETEMEVNFLILGQRHFKGSLLNPSSGQAKTSKKPSPGRQQPPSSSTLPQAPSYAFSVQKLEFLLRSDIKPYFRGEVSLGLHWHLTHSNWGVDLEELFVESSPHIPYWWQLKAGRFHALMGRHNHLHQHDRPFVDPPLPHYQLLGREPFRGNGIALSFAPPIGIWQPQAVLQAFHFGKDIPSGLLLLRNTLDFNSDSSLGLDLAYGAKIKPALYDRCSLSNNPIPDLIRSMTPPRPPLSQDTMKNQCPDEGDRINARVKGLSRMSGNRIPLELQPRLYNIALNYKHKNFLGQKHGLEWTAEFISGKGGKREGSGLSSWIEMGFLKHWIGKARWGYYRDKWWKGRQYSFLVAFAPRDHASIRLQYTLLDNINKESRWNHSLFIQANMGIGTHSSHDAEEELN